MRIDAFNNISQVYRANTSYKAKAVATSYGSDQIEISSFGKDLQIAKAAVKESQDVRMDKVEQMKALISSGQYNVSGMDFANKIVDEFSSGLTL